MGDHRWRGHDIEQTPTGEWVYADTKQPVLDNIGIPCGHCGRPQTAEGHDGCLGTIPGAMNACCGHGNEADAYIQYPPLAAPEPPEGYASTDITAVVFDGEHGQED